ncbi:cbb3-type cytochrome oxidase assembly protein CcoS [Microbulbifer discodermiae]|uniref:cbb3-type cytochrome oxidase assembly protein CcoS n=1 Tax=Microbulbifer sp. 2201CG32-9 TaxID=3232309 RepID=UPI00345BB942
MSSLYFLIPIAILFVAIAVKVFFWAVNSGQYDDLETEGRRILFDDEREGTGLQGDGEAPAKPEQHP